MTILTKADKIQLINSHKRSLEYSKYGLELDVLQENAKSSPNQEEVSRLESLIEETQNQLEALDTELATVNALAE